MFRFLIHNSKRACTVVRNPLIWKQRNTGFSVSTNGQWEYENFFPNVTDLQNYKALCNCNGLHVASPAASVARSYMNMYIHEINDRYANTISVEKDPMIL